MPTARVDTILYIADRNDSRKITLLIKEARNSFLGLGVYLLKSKFRREGKLRFP